MRTSSKSCVTEIEAASDHALPALDCEIDFDDKTEINPTPPTVDATAVPDRAEWVAPIETASAAPTHQAAPAASSAVSASAPTSSQIAGGRRSLSEIWPEPPRKRQLPTRLQLALAGVGVVLISVVAFGSTGPKLQTQAATPLDDDMVVSAEDLKNRREVRADDFRPRGPQQPVVFPAPGPVTAPATTTDSLAERRARRENNPEDVLSLRSRRGAAKATRGSSPDDGPYYNGPVYVSAGSVDPSAASASPSDTAPHQRVAPAGTSVPAVLTSSLQLRGDSATVIAKVDGQTGTLRGARFIGTANAGSGRVTIHFRTVVLADGRQARVDAEAQDEDGTFGLTDGAEPAASDDAPGSVVGGVAQETATDLVSAAIPFNIAGRAVDRYVSGSRTRRSGGGAVRAVSLPPGTKLQVFLHEAVDLGR